MAEQEAPVYVHTLSQVLPDVHAYNTALLGSLSDRTQRAVSNNLLDMVRFAKRDFRTEIGRYGEAPSTMRKAEILAGMMTSHSRCAEAAMIIEDGELVSDWPDADKRYFLSLTLDKEIEELSGYIHGYESLVGAYGEGYTDARRSPRRALFVKTNLAIVEGIKDRLFEPASPSSPQKER